ncbi:hypothetical protein C2G38_2116595 [Gigaspora rosea]|uniref:FAD-dependent oxidoreductase 2 FAD-binding domain-containing protein n=1 Tax=Gigaspora rosea TaxID=44941 RepID=A0A397U7J0_9GLOM|nr:hypothetical protein C2G38_2116595 [Gigaspora rosea]
MSIAVIVVGGLSGLSAAHTVLERGGNVFVLGKNSFFGGNSTKATSGINGALTKTQIALDVQDSAEIFAQDTARSARDLVHPDLIKGLTGNSASVYDDNMEGIEEIANNQPDRARLIKKARVIKLIKEGDAVIGVEYVKDGQTCKEYGLVILATGGYAVDFTEDPLLKKYRPDIYNLPTTNSEHSTGDGHKMVIAIGGKATHMEKVQVHLTGLVPVRLVLNSKASKEIEWHFKHYVGSGLMRKFSDEAFAKEIGISASQLKATFDDHNDIASNKKKDPFGKKFFHNVTITINDQFYVALMSPVLHYIMRYAKQVIPGLFASMAGGVHGANRLGGSSLLGCVVYGRVAGDSASRYLFQNLSSATANRQIFWSSHKDATSQYIPPVQAPQASPSQAPAPEKKADAPTREKKEYTAEEVAKHNKENAILIYAGKDATEVVRKFLLICVVQKYSPESII